MSATDSLLVASIKGLAAGLVNTSLGLLLHSILPHAGVLLAAALVGFIGYGLSLALFVVALRHLGTARTAAYFSWPRSSAGTSMNPMVHEHPHYPDIHHRHSH